MLQKFGVEFKANGRRLIEFRVLCLDTFGFRASGVDSGFTHSSKLVLPIAQKINWKCSFLIRAPRGGKS